MIQDVARAAHGRFGCVALRYFNVAGADPALRSGSRTTNPTHLIGAALQVAAGKTPVLQIFGDDYPTPDGTCERDFIHVSDLAAAHVAALEHLQRNPGSSQVINCGNGRGYSVLEVIEAVRRCTGRPIKTTVVDRRSGDPARVIADPARINQVFNWRPRRQDIDAMVANAYAWQMSWDPPGGRARAAAGLPTRGAKTPADLPTS
jgi:UDP-glucose 4-epimerase